MDSRHIGFDSRSGDYRVQYAAVLPLPVSTKIKKRMTVLLCIALLLAIAAVGATLLQRRNLKRNRREFYRELRALDNRITIIEHHYD